MAGKDRALMTPRQQLIREYTSRVLVENAPMTPEERAEVVALLRTVRVPRTSVNGGGRDAA